MSEMNNVGKMWRHFKTICRHKAIVYRECKACGIWWQGVVHDLSKFSIQEFAPSARYFQGNRSPIEAEKEAIGYSNAWLHHKSHNKHHWEYWCDYDNNTGEVFPHNIPLRYVIEMVCDWIGAGMVYSGEKWTEDEPLNYYYKVRNGRHFHKDTEELIVYLLTVIKQDGLTEFHRVCRSMLSGASKLKEMKRNE